MNAHPALDFSATDDWYCDFVLSGALPVETVAETDTVLAFRHTKPAWTYHVAIIPKRHIARLADLEDMDIVQDIFAVARQIILADSLHEKNYRIITNGGSLQDTKHLHFHLVSGERITP